MLPARLTWSDGEVRSWRVEDRWYLPVKSIIIEKANYKMLTFALLKKKQEWNDTSLFFISYSIFLISPGPVVQWIE